MRSSVADKGALWIVGPSTSARDQAVQWFRAAHWSVQVLSSTREVRAQVASAPRPILLMLLVDEGVKSAEILSRVAAVSGIDTTVSVLVVSWTPRKDVAALLEAGADDVVCGRVNPEELLARARAVTRRISRVVKVARETSLAVVAIDSRLRSATIDGIPIGLTTAEFDLFEYLTSRVNQLVAPWEIIEHVFGTRHTPDTALVRVHIYWLRRKLAATGVEIVTIRGRGYRLVASERSLVKPSSRETGQI